MKIVIKAIPQSLNKFAGRNNAWEYRAEKKEWAMLVSAACRASQNMPKKPFEHALVRIDYYFANAIRHDPDNYCGKVLMDGLTRAGVIQDDDFAHITLSLHGHVDRANPRTEICVVPYFEVTP